MTEHVWFQEDRIKCFATVDFNRCSYHLWKDNHFPSMGFNILFLNLNIFKEFLLPIVKTAKNFSSGARSCILCKLLMTQCLEFVKGFSPVHKFFLCHGVFVVFVCLFLTSCSARPDHTHISSWWSVVGCGPCF